MKIISSDFFLPYSGGISYKTQLSVDFVATFGQIAMSFPTPHNGHTISLFLLFIQLYFWLWQIVGVNFLIVLYCVQNYKRLIKLDFS